MELDHAFGLIVAATLSLTATAQTLVRSVNGPAGSQYGKTCIVVPDQNGDGFKDVLVGAPELNSGRGAVYCVSGAYLASGVGSSHIWGVVPTLNAGDRFGAAIANVGDVTHDGVVDFLVGAPGRDGTAGTNCGSVRLINGSSHSLSAELLGGQSSEWFGSAIAAASDTTGDGAREVVVGAPGPATNGSRIRILKGGALAAGGSPSSSNTLSTIYSGHEFGAALAGGSDLDGDGYDEVVIGDPGADSGANVDAGAIVILSLTPSSNLATAFFASTVPGERFGQSLSMASDYDGDGRADIVVGAPNALDQQGGELGRAVVLSGGRLVSHTAPYEIYTIGNPSAGGLGFDYHTGAGVCASEDLNGDGVGEILVGSPDYFTFVGFNHRGALSIYSGATGAQLSAFYGGTNEQIGEGIAGAVNDLDGDGFKEFVVAGALADGGGTDSGVVKCYRLFPLAPATYCTGKINSLGCTPAISFSGTPSTNPTAPFNITATSFVNQKNGLLFYSRAPVSVPFQGGIKCVLNPTVRTPPMNSGGTTSGSSCTGAYTFDFNDWIANGWDTTLATGDEIFAQYWSRDPQSASHTGLSNAVRFVINP